MDSKPISVSIERDEYFEQMNMTFSMCATVLRHSDMLSSGEMALTRDLIKFLHRLITFYSTVGLSSERGYWEQLMKNMGRVLPDDVISHCL